MIDCQKAGHGRTDLVSHWHPQLTEGVISEVTLVKESHDILSINESI